MSRVIVAMCVALLAGTGAFAQNQPADSSPFTSEEAAQLSAVWSDIRSAESFDDIDWEAVGLGLAPGDAEARRLMAAHWDRLRQAGQFGDIDWEATTGYRPSPPDYFAQQDRGSGPFTRLDADLMSAVWPQIREAASFDDIDWEAVGLIGAPGDSEARRLMAQHWDSLRREPRFSDIDWNAVRQGAFDRPDPQGASDRRSPADPSASGPFTSQEAAQLAAVWSQIRQAASFDNIDWEAVGLDVAPGDAQARRLMAAHWGSLRQAERFGDIDWEATTGYRGR